MAGLASPSPPESGRVMGVCTISRPPRSKKVVITVDASGRLLPATELVTALDTHAMRVQRASVRRSVGSAVTGSASLVRGATAR